MGKYTVWLKIACVFQFITALVHALALFFSPPPGNEKERQIFELMDTYKFDFGAGFQRTMSELTLALSACFSLVCLFGGIVSWYLLSRKVDRSVMKGIINVNILIFGICFGLMAAFTFLPPIILTGLVFIFLLLSRLSVIGKAANPHLSNK